MSLILDSRTTAFVSIDLQKGIMALPLAPYSAAQVVENAANLTRRFVELGATVMRVHVKFASNYADRLSQPVDAPSPPLPKGGMPAEYSDFVDEIGSLPADVTIVKHQWGAFHGTELDLQLRRRGITTIVLCGVATNFGVESTAREAWQHNYSVVIAEDACTSMSPEMHQFSVEKILPRLARVRSTAQIIAALQSA